MTKNEIIQSLLDMAQNREVLERYYPPECDSVKWTKALREASDMIESTTADLEKVKHERDALLKEVFGTCYVCKNENSDKCVDCHFNAYAWNTHENYWQWRGLCSDNRGVDNHVGKSKRGQLGYPRKGHKV